MRLVRLLLCAVLVLPLFSTSVLAGQIPIGLLSFDQVLGNQFDISNFTGPTAPPGFPVLTGLTLTGTLTLNGDCGSSCVSGNITLAPDGTFSSPAFDISKQFVSATFSGTLSPTSGVTVDGDPNPNFLQNSFLVTLTDVGNGTLMDGDFAVIFATTVTPSVPEPSALILLVGGLSGVVSTLSFSRLKKR